MGINGSVVDKYVQNIINKENLKNQLLIKTQLIKRAYFFI